MRALVTMMSMIILGMSAQAQDYFDRNYDSGLTTNQNEGIWNASCHELTDGYICLSFTKSNATGETGNWLIRTDLFGDTLWTKKHLIPEYREFAQNMLAIEGGYVAVSNTVWLNDPDPVYEGDISLTKYDLNGDEIWKMYYGSDTTPEVGTEVIGTYDLGYAVAGQRILGTNDDGNVYLIKTDQNGGQLWEKEYVAGDWDAAQSLLQTPDHGFLLLGWTRSFGAGMRDFYLIKTDSAGNQEWQQTYGTGGDEIGLNILALSDSNYLLVGAGSQGNSMSIGRLYKIDPSGSVIWNRTYIHQSNVSNEFYKAVEPSDGSLVIAGMTHLFNDAGWILKTDSDGNELWQHEYNKTDNTDLFYSLLSTTDGGFLLSGQCFLQQTTKQDAWLLKVDSCGCADPGCLAGCTVGTGEEQLSSGNGQWMIWPNPVAELLSIVSAQPMAVVTLYDTQGRAVCSPIVQGHSRLELDVSALNPGLYIVEVLGTDGQRVVRKAVVQRP